VRSSSTRARLATEAASRLGRPGALYAIAHPSQFLLKHVNALFQPPTRDSIKVGGSGVMLALIAASLRCSFS
jgi:hypothetical protein